MCAGCINTPASGGGQRRWLKKTVNFAQQLQLLAVQVCVWQCVCGCLWQIACADNCSKSIAQKFNWQQNHNHNEQSRAERGKQSLLGECQNRNAHSCRKRRSCCCCSCPDLLTRAIKGLNKACGAAPAPKDRRQTKATAARQIDSHFRRLHSLFGDVAEGQAIGERGRGGAHSLSQY